MRVKVVLIPPTIATQLQALIAIVGGTAHFTVNAIGTAPPGIPNTTPVSTFLDPPDPIRDFADARRIEPTIEGLRAQQARYAALGQGFGFTVLDGSETRLPVIPKSYNKINSGPFVQTSFGSRLLRLVELERLREFTLTNSDFSTGAELIGNGGFNQGCSRI